MKTLIRLLASITKMASPFLILGNVTSAWHLFAILVFTSIVQIWCEVLELHEQRITKALEL